MSEVPLYSALPTLRTRLQRPRVPAVQGVQGQAPREMALADDRRVPARLEGPGRGRGAEAAPEGALLRAPCACASGTRATQRAAMRATPGLVQKQMYQASGQDRRSSGSILQKGLPFTGLPRS
jgi:hypothetical protein